MEIHTGTLKWVPDEVRGVCVARDELNVRKFKDRNQESVIRF